MTLLTHWIQTPAARALGWTLFHFLWEGIAIAAALALLLLVRAGRRGRVIPPLAWRSAAMLARVRRHLHARAARPGARTCPGVDGFAAAAARDRDGDTRMPHSRFQPEDVLPVVAPVWLAGVLLLHLRTIAALDGGAPSVPLRRVRGAAARGRSDSRDWRRACAFPRRSRFWNRAASTCRWWSGYLRPVILIPLGLLTGMPPAHVEAILLHELAHIRRRDYLVNLLQAVAENLLFYHPAVWWISGVIRTERENCCDDLVVAVRGNAYDYAVALTALEESRWTGEPALAATGGNLMKRIHRLLDRPEPRHAALTPAFSASVILRDRCRRAGGLAAKTRGTPAGARRKLRFADDAATRSGSRRTWRTSSPTRSAPPSGN